MRPLLILLLLAGCASCEGDAAPRSGVKTPARQFTFEGLQIEEHRAGHVVWSGKAARADGDLNEADVEQITVDLPAREGRPTEYRLQAPRGRIAFEGDSVLQDVLITDPEGGSLRAGTAHYLEAEREIRAEGPLEFAARGLRASADRAVIHLDAGTIDIEGPVQGRFVPQPK